MQSANISALSLFIYRLTEAEFKLDLLEKDPYALDVPVRPIRGTVPNCKTDPNSSGFWFCFLRWHTFNCFKPILATCMYKSVVLKKKKKP